MLKKEWRLNKNQVQWLIKKAQNRQNEFYSMKFISNQLKHPRVSVSISKKMLKHATDRNHLRRQIYEIVRLHFQENPSSSGFDGLILPRFKVLNQSFQEQKIALTSLLKGL